jgi:hypothetical protein
VSFNKLSAQLLTHTERPLLINSPMQFSTQAVLLELINFPIGQDIYCAIKNIIINVVEIL